MRSFAKAKTPCESGLKVWPDDALLHDRPFCIASSGESMSKITVVSYQEHGNKRWYKPENFGFAAKDRFLVLGLSEIPKAMLSLPLAFAKNDAGYFPVVVQGFITGKNLLVNADGKWLADYVPLLYRSRPFKLAKNPSSQFILCVDEDSGLISETAAGYPFFADEKALADEVNAIAAQLMQFESDRERSAQLCKLLDANGLFEPWVLQLQQEKEILNVEGMYRINEKKLNELAAEPLLEIRRLGGLVICYAQLFSMQHVQQLGSVAQRSHWANTADVGAPKVAGLNIVDDNGIVSFANL